MIIMNAGSENKGGTFEQAVKNAKKWLKNINKEFPEVEMSTEEKFVDGDWEFVFTHKITGVSVLLHIHGFTEEECKNFVFRPRIYWNGSSTADPKVEDWLTDEFSYRVVYERKK